MEEEIRLNGLRAGLSLQIASQTPFIAGDSQCLTKEDRKDD
jgi:hypothetical protein